MESDIRDAQRSRNQEKLDTLRFLKSKIQRAEMDKAEAQFASTGQVDETPTLDETGVLEVIARQVKERRDSIRAFEEGHRDDLVAKEAAELAIIEVYLPPQMGREELTRIIQGVIQEVGADSPRDKGKVMGRLMPQVRGKADGNQVNEIVTELLGAGG